MSSREMQHAEFVAPAAIGSATAQPPRVALPCPFTAHGMQQPSSVQPPPMFGPRGPTIPAKHLHEYRRGGEAGGGHDRRGGGRGGGGRGRGGGRGGSHSFNSGGGENGYAPKQRFQRPSDNPHRRQHANPFDKPQQPPAAATFEQPAPVRGAFWCEPCDSDFPTGEQLTAHRAQHQRCSVDGCQFEGHAQLVSRHVQQQHTSGLFERIKNLQTPEEIERWREERKRRYPSSKNVALRQQIQEARQKRGERLEPQSSQRFGDKADRRQPPGATKSDVATKNDGHNAGGDVTANGKNKRRRKRNKTGQKDAAAVMLDEVAKLGDAVEEVNCGLPMFRGTSGMKGYRKPEVKVANALSGLLGAYDSEESEEVTSEEEAAEVLMPGEYPVLESSSECTEADGLVEKNEEIHEQKNDVETEQIETIPDENIEEPIEDDDADNGPPEEDAVERISSLPEMPEHATETPATTKRPSNENNTASSASAAKRSKTTMSLDLSRRYRNQNTMLEKLLQKDIRHERNVLLQCVRYVVEQKFFGIGQAK